MNSIGKYLLSGLLILTFFSANQLRADDPPAGVAGLYKAVLSHESTKFYQLAEITIRATNPGGQGVKYSANVRVFFGGWNSNEFLTYEYDEVPLSLITGQFSIKNDKNDVTMIGIRRGDSLEGDWYSTQLGRVGKFIAKKNVEPNMPGDGVLVKSLSGYYRGSLVNTNPEVNLPERVTLSFITTQVTTPETGVKVSGNTRFYIGDFGSLEYEEDKFTDIQFNFYKRFLTAKTEKYGFTYKGTMSVDGVFTGVLYSDGLGEIAKVTLKAFP